MLGNLSFKLLGRNGRPFPIKKITVNDIEERYKNIYTNGKEDKCIYIYNQKRYPDDTKIPFLSVMFFFIPHNIKVLIKMALNYSIVKLIDTASKLIKRDDLKINRFIDEYFFIITKSNIDETKDAEKEIEGYIFSFNGSSISNKNKIIRFIIEYCNRSENNKNVKNIWIEKESLYGFITKFTINRSGECCMEMFNIIKEGCVHELHTTKHGKKSLKYAIEQSFLFARDMLHTHKHHDYWEDSITNIHETISNSTSPLRWTDQVVKDMIIYTISTRENNDVRSLGVIQYIKAFITIYKEKSNDDRYLINRVRQIEGLERSIEYSIRRFNSKLDNFKFIMTLFIAVLAATFTIASQLYEKNITRFIESMPTWTFFLIVLLLISAIIIPLNTSITKKEVVSKIIISDIQAILSMSRKRPKMALFVYFILLSSIFFISSLLLIYNFI